MTKKELYVIAKCVGCGKERKIMAGEIPKGEHPMCDVCYMPLVADRADIKEVLDDKE